tara:strand:+ start:1171 stop:1311 length:141 start_codon:yes stop_codon:yes gene_type:complete
VENTNNDVVEVHVTGVSISGEVNNDTNGSDEESKTETPGSENNDSE